MQDSPKRKHSYIPLTLIFRVYSQKIYPSTGRIDSEQHAKESQDFFTAENYYNKLRKKLTNTNIIMEELFINNDNTTLRYYTVSRRWIPPLTAIRAAKTAANDSYILVGELCLKFLNHLFC